METEGKKELDQTFLVSVYIFLWAWQKETTNVNELMRNANEDRREPST